MSDFFDLTLDTAAPVVTFGSVVGTTAGQQLQVDYTVDEPASLVAKLTLSDAREFTMGVTGTRFQYVLPLDAPTGIATVEVTAEDDLGNVAVYTLDIPLFGAIVEAPVHIEAAGAERQAGITPTAEESPHFLRRSRSRVLVGHRRQIAAAARRRASRGVTRTSIISSAHVQNVAISRVNTVAAISSSRVLISTAQPETDVAIYRVVDGPSVEESLMALGVL